MTEKEKMLAGEWFSSPDEELTVERRRTERLLRRLNVELTADDEAYRTTLRELLAPGSEGFIRAPFYCDYGYNISLGRGTFLNFDCVILDLASVRIGCRTLIGPKVQLLTAHHPFDVQQRAAGLEAGRPIEIGDDCWLGGGGIVCRGHARHSRRFGGRGQPRPRHPHPGQIIRGAGRAGAETEKEQRREQGRKQSQRRKQRRMHLPAPHLPSDTPIMHGTPPRRRRFGPAKYDFEPRRPRFPILFPIFACFNDNHKHAI